MIIATAILFLKGGDLYLGMGASVKAPTSLIAPAINGSILIILLARKESNEREMRPGVSRGVVPHFDTA